MKKRRVIFDESRISPLTYKSQKSRRKIQVEECNQGKRVEKS